MAELGELTLDHFAGHVGEAFTVGPVFDPQGEQLTLEVHLREAVALGPVPEEGRRAPFSLIFTGPIELMLSQGIHRLDHAEMGMFEPFLVPVQPQDGQARYQAVFT
jgi:hypothetical protein